MKGFSIRNAFQQRPTFVKTQHKPLAGKISRTRAGRGGRFPETCFVLTILGGLLVNCVVEQTRFCSSVGNVAPAPRASQSSKGEARSAFRTRGRVLTVLLWIELCLAVLGY